MENNLKKLNKLAVFEENPNLAILDTLEEIKDSIDQKEIPQPVDSFSITNPDDINYPIVSGIEEIKNLIIEYVNSKDDKENKMATDKRHEEKEKEYKKEKEQRHKDLLSAIDKISKSFPTVPRPYDYTSYLDSVLVELRKDKKNDLSKLEKLVSKLSDELSSKKYFPENVIKYDRLKVELSDEQLKKMGGSNNQVVSSGGGVGNETFITEIRSLKSSMDTLVTAFALQGYQPADMDDSTATEYYGFIDKNGKWVIKQVTTSTVKFSNGSSDYSTSWTGRAGLTYKYFNEITL